MELIEAKTILTKSKNGNSWYGIDYNMNLYRGCSHGCIYCDSRSDCYHIDNFDNIKVKKDALLILERELRNKKKTGVVGIGSMSDPYNPLESNLELTRESLKLIKKYGFGVSIDTKSDLIVRDIDLLKEINKNNDVIVKFTITTPIDELSKIIEPKVACSSKRFASVKELSDKYLNELIKEKNITLNQLGGESLIKKGIYEISLGKLPTKNQLVMLTIALALKNNERLKLFDLASNEVKNSAESNTYLFDTNNARDMLLIHWMNNLEELNEIAKKRNKLPTEILNDILRESSYSTLK